MKGLLTALLCLTMGHFSQASMEDMMADANDCKTTWKTTDDDVALIKSGEMPKEESGKCMLYCMMNKLDLVDDDGKLKSVGMKAMVDEMSKPDDAPKIQAAVDACATEAEAKYKAVAEDTDKCDNTGIVYECIVAKFKEAGIEHPMKS